MPQNEIEFYRELRELFIRHGVEMRGQFWMGNGTLLISDANRVAHPNDILITEASIVLVSTD